MGLSINNVSQSNYAAYKTQLYNSVDRNSDGIYSKTEVSRFADAYEKSTGSKIDVDGLFKAYDVDLSGALSEEEFQKVAADDALKMDALFGAGNKSEVKNEAGTKKTDASSWLSKLSSREKVSLTRATWKAETSVNFLNAMFSSGSLFSGARMNGSSYMANALMQYNNSKLSSIASSLSSLNMLL